MFLYPSLLQYVLKYWNVYNYRVYISGNAFESSVRSQRQQFTVDNILSYTSLSIALHTVEEVNACRSLLCMLIKFVVMNRGYNLPIFIYLVYYRRLFQLPWSAN
jgi:hypothetical protein